MIIPPESLEGWTPMPEGPAELATLVDLAFDYRGDVTVILADGARRSGYLFDRQRDSGDPFAQLLEADASAPVTIRYRDIRTIHFTGKDTAAGKSYAAWLGRKTSRAPQSSASDA